MGEERREFIKGVQCQPRPTFVENFDCDRCGTGRDKSPKINLQNYCADLFHFDVPWNPSRMEQRNGRIDRKLQREPEVRCHYFVLSQRVEDRVLDVLVQKTKRRQQEVGSLSPVVEKNVTKLLDGGIRQAEVQKLTTAINAADQPDQESKQHSSAIKEELEAIRLRQDKLRQQQVELETMLKDSKVWLGLDDRHFRDTLSVSLEIMGSEPLKPMDAATAIDDEDRSQWVVPALDQQAGAEPTWATTLDTLRTPRQKTQQLWDWRREAPIPTQQ